jgi:hypothetical protein
MMTIPSFFLETHKENKETKRGLYFPMNPIYYLIYLGIHGRRGPAGTIRHKFRVEGGCVSKFTFLAVF